MLCVLCDAALPAAADSRCLTDCAHEFCLSCVCRALSARGNRCPICDARIRTVHQQLVEDVESNEKGVAPASIRFCNAVYVLHVSIWSVDDPARVLAELFQLEQARLVHKGKLLKKGDVWPGTVVQLFGTRRGTSERGLSTRPWASMTALWTETAWMQRVMQVVCCPLLVIVAFFRSLFVHDDHQRRGYQRLDNPAGEAATASRAASFHAPGAVASPRYTESVE